MTLGEKLKAARLEAGLSQRQLCGETITRNMLSQIENGSANPSMATLQYLAGQLGKPLGYFVEEDGVASPNPKVMDRARQAYGGRQYREVLAALEEYKGPDPLFEEEYGYLSALAALGYAEELLGQGDAATAEVLLDGVHRSSIYYRVDMERHRRLLLSRAYPILEAQCREQEDFRMAYEYACKARQLPK